MLGWGQNFSGGIILPPMGWLDKPWSLSFCGCVCVRVVPAPRGDLEILGYCLLQWLCGRLPWEDRLDDKNYVRDEKNR